MTVQDKLSQAYEKATESEDPEPIHIWIQSTNNEDIGLLEVSGSNLVTVESLVQDDVSEVIETSDMSFDEFSKQVQNILTFSDMIASPFKED